MEFSFEVRVLLTLDHKKGCSLSRHVSTKYTLDTKGILDKRYYIDADGLPTEHGSKVLTNVLVQGLVANIHACHERKFKDSAEHLRYIISELERGFVNVTEVSTSTYDKD